MDADEEEDCGVVCAFSVLFILFGALLLLYYSFELSYRIVKHYSSAQYVCIPVNLILGLVLAVLILPCMLICLPFSMVFVCMVTGPHFYYRVPYDRYKSNK